MRVNSRWFRQGRERSPREIAGAVAFAAFRIARNAQQRLGKAGFDLSPGPDYFVVIAEFLVFLVFAADRIVAQRRGDGAWRVEFTTTLANRVGAILAENEADLLGVDDVRRAKERFIARVNARAVDYAACGSDDGPDYDLLRCAGHRVAEAMAAEDRTWAVPQVIDIEAPEAVATLRRAMRGLLDAAPADAPAPQRLQGE